jgi:hypothetical protein
VDGVGLGEYVPAVREGLVGWSRGEPLLQLLCAVAPAAPLAEHCTTWEQTHGVRVSVPTMYRAIRALNWTRKKGL